MQAGRLLKRIGVFIGYEKIVIQKKYVLYEQVIPLSCCRARRWRRVGKRQCPQHQWEPEIVSVVLLSCISNANGRVLLSGEPYFVPSLYVVVFPPKASLRVVVKVLLLSSISYPSHTHLAGSFLFELVSQYVKELFSSVLERFALASSFPFPNAKIRPPHCGLRMIAKIFLCRILCACYPAVCATRAHSVRYSATVLQFKKWLSPNQKIILYLYIYI